MRRGLRVNRPPASRRRVIVHGQVQGVGFRIACARRAAEAQLRGWVRNLPDGTVEAVFEGESSAVERLTSWSADGPPMARVTRVEVFDEPLVGEVGFSVR